MNRENTMISTPCCCSLFVIHSFQLFGVNSHLISNLSHATRIGTFKDPKYWFSFCELYLYQSLKPRLTNKHYSFSQHKGSLGKNSYKPFLENIPIPLSGN